MVEDVTVKTIAARILAVEHRLYRLAIRQLLGPWRVIGRRFLGLPTNGGPCSVR